MGPDDDDSSLYGTGNIGSPIGSTTRNTGNRVSNVSQSITKLAHAQSSITKMKEPLDDTNWVVWREWIRRIFRLCRVDPYVYGNLARPDPATDPDCKGDYRLGAGVKLSLYERVFTRTQ